MNKKTQINQNCDFNCILIDFDNVHVLLIISSRAMSSVELL